jgi:phospholipid/cholesterol/gamma-HCH transport system permease protein
VGEGVSPSRIRTDCGILPALPGLDHRLEVGPGGEVLHLAGAIDRGTARALTVILAGKRSAGGRLLLDLSGVVSMDSAGVGVLVDAWRRAPGALSVGALSPAAERALSMFRVGPDSTPAPKPAGLLEGIGAQIFLGRDALRDLLQLAADATFALLAAVVRPRRLRWDALTEQCIDIGSRALRIVALIVFLVGLTVAFQSAYQLRQFGAAIFVADLTAVSVVREMGPLMTAILVAGRSGSSIAAEIATMQVSEEIDALKVMGVDPIGFLAVPRLLALLIVMPLLTALADVVGIAGGFLVGTFYLDLAPVAFLNQVLQALTPFDVVSGIIKSVAFAFGIGLIGLFYGFRVRGGASEVGRTTTASVVASIFYIIVADCLFSVVFYIIL